MRFAHQTCFLLLLFFWGAACAQDGNVVERTRYYIPEASIAQARSSVPDIDQLLELVEVYRITYLSDGLRVKGFLVQPAAEGPHPAVIFNRGGNRDFGVVNDQLLLRLLIPMANWGYVVVASQYRGNDGSEGQDEFGGADVNDVLNLIPFLAHVPQADTTRIGMMGGSRGGLMTYLALARTTRIKAAVVQAGLTDAFRSVSERPEMGRVFAETALGYAINADSVLATRSPIRWVEKLCPTTPILILHGTADWRVSPKDAMDMADSLYAHQRPFRLQLFEGGDHGLTEYRTEAQAAMRSFLDRYVRNGEHWPSLEPHGR
jgi:dipeptidyl aminopeptidase/acylaminoacyl peptidase